MTTNDTTVSGAREAASPEARHAAGVLSGELAAVRGELARADAVCGLLAAGAGAGLAVTQTAASASAPLLARVLLVVAALAWSSAGLVLLVWAVRPRLGPTGFRRWSAMTPAQAAAEARGIDNADHTAGELVVLSKIARRKFRAIRIAVDVMAAGLLALAGSILTGVIS